MNQDTKQYPPMSTRYTPELLRNLNGLQLLTLIAHFGMGQVCARLGIAQQVKTNAN